MEPEAESRCDALITEALMVDDKSAESWSVLGSIRISQQRVEEAKKALAQSWDLYKSDVDASVPSLIRLAQNMIETQLFELAYRVTKKINLIDDQIAECYYLQGLAAIEMYMAGPKVSTRYLVRALTAWESLEKLAQITQVDPEILQAVHQQRSQLPAVEGDHEYSTSEDDDDEDELQNGEEEDEEIDWDGFE